MSQRSLTLIVSALTILAMVVSVSASWAVTTYKIDRKLDIATYLQKRDSVVNSLTNLEQKVDTVISIVIDVKCEVLQSTSRLTGCQGRR